MVKKQAGESITDKEKMFQISDTVRAISIPPSKIIELDKTDGINPLSEKEKMDLVRERFENIDEDDLMDGQEFFDSLDSEEPDNE